MKKMQISSKILPHIPNFANFVRFRPKLIFLPRLPVFVISSAFRQKRNSLELINVPWWQLSLKMKGIVPDPLATPLPFTFVLWMQPRAHCQFCLEAADQTYHFYSCNGRYCSERVLAMGILSVCLSARPSVRGVTTTQYRIKPRWDRDSGFSRYGSLESSFLWGNCGADRWGDSPRTRASKKGTP